MESTANKWPAEEQSSARKAIQKRNFPNLNGVRCIAAMSVLIHHLEQAKHTYGVVNIYEITVVKHAGRLGVGLFFVLSGFLITYLLLQEKGNFGDISAPKFYLRRVFRIWPIYYVMVLLAIFVFPNFSIFYYPGVTELLQRNFTERLSLLMLVLPNYAFVLYGIPYWAAQAWSIGVEEQFYYLWPWIIKYPKKTIGIVAIFLAATVGLLALGIYFLDAPEVRKIDGVLTFIGQFRLLIMALGGAGAYAVYKNNTRILNVLYRKDLQIGVYILFLICFFSGIHIPAFMEVYSLFFCFFILNVATNPNSIISLENPIVSYLGKISYGLYLYHVVVSIVFINLLRMYAPELSTTVYNLILYPCVIGFSVLVSGLSYEYFEKPLLRFKDERYGR
ncbi:acyltransferase [Siphonobacter sp. SORGH_AS_0500]|uniref:acyltransferase family protein n=1 Tax=Siphonobacter sp. SORGH_AS_0500 TaxID=1864824 RepID=UPI00285EA83E|nr:acyltransferase [Siphonobacter sp. SORGH_AS_0500]MDR6196443.1 peptidoglycan/LPS O-acetylase OafA/YrhL [Siphonobacter sp. SORGH_AS_0500]